MEVLKLTKKNFKQVTERSIKAIEEGKVIICPTDTVYGFLGNAKDKRTVNNIFKIKKRPKNKPFPIFVKNLKMAAKFAKINKFQEKFLKKFWPGKVTVVLKRRKNKIYGVLKESIALRIPKYKLINRILEKTNLPLIGTSANILGKKSSTKIREVLNQFKNQKDLPDLVLDAGNLKESKPSTVIDLRQEKIKIVRQGEIEMKFDDVLVI